MAVHLVSTDAGWRSVALTLALGEGMATRICLRPAQVKQLVEMLRLAAAPGRNLVQARFNLRRTGPSKQP